MMTHEYMTYREICLFIQKTLFRNDHILKKEDLINYYASIKKDPFLKAVMEVFPPYSKRWEKICPAEEQFFLNQRDYTKEVHSAAAQMPLTTAIKYFEEKYQIQTFTPEQRLEIAKDILHEVELQLQTGCYNNLLESEERNRRWTKARDGARKRGEVFCASMVESSHSVKQLTSDLISYIQKLRRYLSTNALMLDELIYLRRWVAEAENTPSSRELTDRWAGLIACLDESRTSNFIDNDTSSSCARGTMERLQVRMYYIALASESAPPRLLEYSLVEQLIMPFVQKEPQEPTRYHPTPYLYQIYRQACAIPRSSPLPLKEIADQEIITRMAEMIGFGVEHVELLLSIVGQYFYTYHPVATPTLPGLDYLAMCFDNGVTQLNQEELLQKAPVWDKQQAEQSYLAYLHTRPSNLSNYPLVTLMPYGLRSEPLYYQCLRNMEEIAENELNFNGRCEYINIYNCSYDLFARLITTRQVRVFESAPHLLLEYFCEKGHKRAVVALIEDRRANINHKRLNDGYTPLLRAIMADQEEIISYILTHCDINKTQPRVHYTPFLEYLYANGKKHALELLIASQKIEINGQDTLGRSFLKMVIANKDTDFAKKLIACPSVREYFEKNIAHEEVFCAIETEQWGLVQELKNISKLNTPYFAYYFDYALKQGNNSVALKMLQHQDIKMSILDNTQYKPLWYALQFKDPKVQHVILADHHSTFDINNVSESISVVVNNMRTSTGYWSQKSLKFLLRCSPCPLSELKDRHGNALIFMVLRRYIETRYECFALKETFSWLLDQFFDDPDNIHAQNSNGATPLMLLIQHGLLEKVLVLLGKFPKIDVEQQDNTKNTALIYAIQRYIKMEGFSLWDNSACFNVIQVLGAKGANLYHCNEAQESALSLALSSDTELFQSLLHQPSFNPHKQHQHLSNVIFARLRKIIHQDSSFTFTSNIELLLRDRRINPNVQDSDGDTALMMALNIRDDLDNLFVTLLRNRRIDLNIRNNRGDTVLMMAIKNNDSRTLEILRCKNIDINAQDLQGNTALMLAAQKGDCCLIRAIIAYDGGLLRPKVDFNIKNNQGQTALDQALTLKAKNLLFDKAHPILGCFLKPFFFSQQQAVVNGPAPQNHSK